ncbi:MAG: hypothetical protein CMJ83_18450 [Planctomycetes bacterium]|nr:hypothetical protein [Planctomycetota bacterium]
MFDVVATNPVFVNDFDCNMDAGTWDVAIYVVTGGGTWSGNQTNAGNWTLLTTVTGVSSAGIGNPTNLGVNLGHMIGAGATQGFYLTATNGTSFNYTNGSSVGAVYSSDANISILEGAGKSYPFGSTFQPRVWNGTVHYGPGSGIFAAFSGTPLTGPAPLAVSFTDMSFSSDPGGITSWMWDFGDGNNSTAQHPTHPYTTAGTYSVTLVVTDATNGSDTEMKTDYVVVDAPDLVFSTTGVGDVTISGPPDPAGTSQGFLLISGNPAATIGGGPFFGLQPDATTFLILTMPPTVGGLFSYSPNAATFPNVPISFGPGTLALGLTLDGVLVQVVSGALVVSNNARLNT